MGLALLAMELVEAMSMRRKTTPANPKREPSRRVPAATRKQWATNLAANQLRSFTDQVHTCLSAMTERQRHITMVSVACVIGGVPAVAAQFDAVPPRKRTAKAKPRGR